MMKEQRGRTLRGFPCENHQASRDVSETQTSIFSFEMMTEQVRIRPSGRIHSNLDRSAIHTSAGITQMKRFPEYIIIILFSNVLLIKPYAHSLPKAFK